MNWEHFFFIHQPFDLYYDDRLVVKGGYYDQIIRGFTAPQSFRHKVILVPKLILPKIHPRVKHAQKLVKTTMTEPIHRHLQQPLLPPWLPTSLRQPSTITCRHPLLPPLPLNGVKSVKKQQQNNDISTRCCSGYFLWIKSSITPITTYDDHRVLIFNTSMFYPCSLIDTSCVMLLESREICYTIKTLWHQQHCK